MAYGDSWADQVEEAQCRQMMEDEAVEKAERRAFYIGAQVMREMLARFVEQGGAVTADSIRATWVRSWGQSADPGRWDGEIPESPWDALPYDS